MTTSEQLSRRLCRNGKDYTSKLQLPVSFGDHVAAIGICMVRTRDWNVFDLEEKRGMLNSLPVVRFRISILWLQFLNVWKRTREEKMENNVSAIRLPCLTLFRALMCPKSKPQMLTNISFRS